MNCIGNPAGGESGGGSARPGRCQNHPEKWKLASVTGRGLSRSSLHSRVIRSAGVVPVGIGALSSSPAISSVVGFMPRCAKIQNRWNAPSDGSRSIQKQLITRIASANPGGTRRKLRGKAHENVAQNVHVSSGGIDKRRQYRRFGRRRTATGIPTGKRLRGEA
jgi:hypothetical protein